MINKKLESLENIERSTIYTKVERKNDSFLDFYERIKALNSPLEKEREFEPHHRSCLTKTKTKNWNNERNSVIENWHTNNSRKNDREPKAIAITYNDIERQKSSKDSLTEASDERSSNNLKLANSKEKLRKNLDIEEEIEKERDEKEKDKGDSLVNKGWKTSNNSSKEMVEKHNYKEEASS